MCERTSKELEIFYCIILLTKHFFGGQDFDWLFRLSAEKKVEIF